MNAKRAYIIYSLPKSRTNQALNKRKVDEVIEDTKRFLEACTTGNGNNPDEVRLTAYAAYDDVEASSPLGKMIDKARGKFGKSESSPIAYHYPSGMPHSMNKHEWTLSHDKLEEAINYLSENSPMLKSDYGPLGLLLSYVFKLADPQSTLELPNQQYSSYLIIWLSRGNSCSPNLFFPFEQPDMNFWTYLDSLSTFLPFKLEEKYLRLAHMNNSGEIKSFKKIERPKL